LNFALIYYTTFRLKQENVTRNYQQATFSMNQVKLICSLKKTTNQVQYRYMKQENFKNTPERETPPPFTPPPVELFADPVITAAAWPKSIVGKKEFQEQVKSRAVLNKRLDAVMTAVSRPDMSLQTAVEEKRLTEKQIADMYTSLGELLTDDRDYERIILYLPFEFLPNADWQPTSKELQRAAEKFRTAYLSAWHNLLTTLDVRANFVDGDVLDVESRTGDLPRVVKAAHLIPKLVEKGVLATTDVFALLDSSENEILTHSIADALPVLADLGLLHETELKRMKASSDSSIRAKAELIGSPATIEKKKTIGVTHASIKQNLQTAFQFADAVQYHGITGKRIAWLKQEAKRQAVETAGRNIAAAIAEQVFNEQTAATFLSAESDNASRLALVEGIRRAIEGADKAQSTTLFNRFEKTLSALWHNDVPAIQDALAKTFFRLNGLGVVDDMQLKTLGLTRPHLAGPFSENVKSLEGEMTMIHKMALASESDPELTKYIYPVALVFGSRLKGYGAKSADLDIAVLVRPDTPPNNSDRLQTLLQKNFNHEKIHGEIVEFRLQKDKNCLSVIDKESSAPSVGDSYWTHVLFGATWVGDPDAIKELREKLLTPYLYDEGKMIHGRDARGLYLEELERDTLQYRLMHKGYAKFYPSCGGINTPHAGEIDGQSSFWDSGYRRLATKLFASRVFLPKLKP